MPPQVPFGRYILLDRIAVGGMAEIFFAKAKGEAGFEKACVIKRVLPHLAARTDFVQMFLDEARIAARLNHPGIVQIFDLGKEGEDYFISMEYLPGEDLSAVMYQCWEKQVDMPLEVATKIISSAAEALHYAHELRSEDGRPLGIVHRDISPSNLLVTYQGTTKILDFGIARAELRLQQTEVGQVKGKAAYMAPEQALGKPVDRRADIWSLGVCLHELLTGQRLFARDTSPATVTAVCKEPIPSPSEVRPGIPLALSRVVMKALSRDLDGRYTTAEELRAALESILGDRTYVPQTIQIGQFLRELFGPDRATEQERRATALSDPGVALRTEHFPESSLTLMAGGDPSTLTDRARPKQRMAKRAVLVGAALGLLGTLGVAGFIRAKPPEPPPPVATPRYAVELETIPADAAIYLDGERRPERTPAVLEGLSPGRYELRFSKDGFHSQKTSVTLRPDQPKASLSIRLEPNRDLVSVGSLSVTSDPPGATVTLDGKRQPGATPLSLTEVSSDEEHELVLEKAGFEPRSARVTLAAGEARTLAVALKRLSQTVEQARLVVSSHPSGAAVFLDGKPRGRTPLALLAPPGTRTVAIESPGFRRYERRMKVNAGQERAVSAELKPLVSDTGRLSVEANVPANAWLDGTRLGPLPIAGRKVPAGRHQLRLENKELGISRTVRVTVKPDAEVRHVESFRKGRLNVNAKPWADVWLDGTRLGQTPLAGREVWEGRHTLRLVGPGGEKTVAIDVPAGETVVVKETIP